MANGAIRRWNLALVALLALIPLACDSGNGPTEPQSPGAGPLSDVSSGAQPGGQALEGPGIDLEKATNGEDADMEPGPEILVGDPVEWTYVVTNIGTVALTEVTVLDDQLGAISCPLDRLGPGESMTCTASGTAVEGPYSNLGEATGRDTPETTVTDEDPSHYLGVLPVAEVDVEKSTNGEDADLAPGPELMVGAPVSWEYVVTNVGDLELTDIAVVDDQIGAITCPRTTLGVGESMVCTADGTAVLGQYSNLGTVTARGPAQEEVSDEDPSHYLGIEEIGAEGCSHGYWKNHLDSWVPTGYTPDQTVDSVFAQAVAFPTLGASSLLEALRFGGGPGAEGGAMILLRQAVGALLNAAHPDVDFPRSPAQLIAEVDAALASGDRQTMLTLKDGLDADNNLGCPLN